MYRAKIIAEVGSLLLFSSLTTLATATASLLLFYLFIIYFYLFSHCSSHAFIHSLARSNCFENPVERTYEIIATKKNFIK